MQPATIRSPIKTQGIFIISINTKTITKMAKKALHLHSTSDSEIRYRLYEVSDRSTTPPAHFHNYTIHHHIDDEMSPITFRMFYAQKLNTGYDSEVNELWLEVAKKPIDENYQIWKTYFKVVEKYPNDVHITQDLDGSIITWANFRRERDFLTFKRVFSAKGFDFAEGSYRELEEGEVLHILQRMKKQGVIEDRD